MEERYVFQDVIISHHKKVTGNKIHKIQGSEAEQEVYGKREEETLLVMCLSRFLLSPQQSRVAPEKGT